MFQDHLQQSDTAIKQIGFLQQKLPHSFHGTGNILETLESLEKLIKPKLICLQENYENYENYGIFEITQSAEYWLGNGNSKSRAGLFYGAPSQKSQSQEL